MAKFTVNNSGVIYEFDTLAEFDAYVASISPNDPAIVTASAQVNQEKQLSRDLADDLRLEFKKQINAATLTVTQATDIFNRVQTTFLALGLGWLRESRMLANNTATGGSFTQGRKDFLLAQIDAAIAKLS